MTNQQIEKLIRDAEQELSSGSLKRVGMTGAASTLLTPLVLVADIAIVGGVLAGVAWIITFSLWADCKSLRRDFKVKRAHAVWEGITLTKVFGASPNAKTRELLQEIARVYDRDPQGEVLPLSQAVRLVLVWQQQQERLQLVGDHMRQMTVLQHRLLDKQKLLRELNDDNTQIEKALAQLNADLLALERSHDSLRASCVRLESLISTVDAAARRRQLHREVGELAAQLGPGDDTALQVSDEHLDLERQIGREIETFLELERETAAHLREL